MKAAHCKHLAPARILWRARGRRSLWGQMGAFQGNKTEGEQIYIISRSALLCGLAKT